jgi:DNA-binding protein HU-beta
MTKDELVAKVANKVDMPKVNVNKILKATLDSITEALKKDDKVSFVGFGTFMVAKRAAKMGRNPKTGAPLKIPAAKVPKFRPGKALKEAVKR